ncbi:hypothetical protein S7711_06952 [Stachybotrys chartarum IBT 7711]|uniref:Poly [ADP-ribose] polymerase n=1 Tax=Stachybotrys chartarum (strain CBS 109288 / IBT 7711) TaxID=1280523 RepID=A0A084ARW2_STACB|nr:hypothetical protein S7711_06952 [Stachybotrys chartarum IBT 7711]
MPPRRKASQKADPPSLPLDGCAIALSGRFDGVGHTHGSLEQIIRSLGGSVTKSVTKTTTHVVCTGDDYEANAIKVAAGKDKDLSLLNPSWILDCEEQKAKVDEKEHLWSQTAVKGSANGTANGNSAGADGSKKRQVADASAGGDNDEPKAKKTKGAKAANVKDEPDANPPSLETEKKVAEGQFLTKKTVIVSRDEHCPLATYQVYIDPDSGMIYDANLNQSNSSHNNNKFYRLLHDPKSNSFKTWTRWGRVGEVGQSAELGDGSFKAAEKAFGKKFRDKSGLAWEQRGDDPKPGKYAFVERSYDPDSDDDDDDDAKDAKASSDKQEAPEHDVKPITPDCTLDKPVKELMELIFNQDYFQATMTALNYDAQKLPLGKLSKATIMRGFQQLKDLAALMDDSSLAASRWQMPLPQAMEHLSNTYYSVIPHAFGRNRPPVIREDNLLKKEIELLESLSDMKDAADIMKIDRKAVRDIHPLDRQFQGLNLTEMTPLDHNGSEFKVLTEYLHGSRGATHNYKYDVQDVFRIERNGEKARFDSSRFASIPSNRRLLWHGSRCTNFGGILSQGLRIAPPEAPVSGYMFGKGIYLADMSSKSAGYCASYNTNGHALLLLCEAELGTPMQELLNASYEAGSTAKKNNMIATWGQGRNGPSRWVDAGIAHESLKGIQMPDPSSNGSTDLPQASLWYNEYICYDVAQVKLRYLFRVKM